MSELTPDLEPVSDLVSSTVPEAPSAVAPEPARWSFVTRLAFRFAFCYFMLYALCCGNATLWWAIPLYGLRLEGRAAAPFNHAAQWFGQQLFHLHGAGAHLHASGFNDRALDWVAAGLMLIVAIVATIVWSVLDRRRTQYTTLFAWFRFTLRLALIAGMFIYGDMKIFPIQIGRPSLAVLNETIGSASPMTMLWTVLGMNPAYEVLCGVVECCAGVLLLFRRTALAGVLLSIVILSNIVLFDFFFDIPVKLYATNLLLMAVVVLAPDLRAIFGFFWSHRPSAPTSEWVPPFHNPGLRHAIVAVEVLFAVMFCAMLPFRDYQHWARETANLRHPSQLTGQWHLDAALLDGMPHPYLTGDGQPMTELFLDPTGRINMRAADDTLWTGGRTDYPDHLLQIMSPVRHSLLYEIHQPDPTHLVLVPTAQAAGYPELHLTRVPIPMHYRLFDRGLHLVNEWGFEQ